MITDLVRSGKTFGCYYKTHPERIGGSDEIVVEVWVGPEPIGEPQDVWTWPKLIGVTEAIKRSLKDTRDRYGVKESK